jgi:hypothetical protein
VVVPFGASITVLFGWFVAHAPEFVVPVEYSCSAFRRDAWNCSTSSRLRFESRPCTSASVRIVSVILTGLSVVYAS